MISPLPARLTHRLAAAATALIISIGPAQASSPAATGEPNWVTGENLSLAGVLFPHFHFNSVYGGTTVRELPEIAHHDPREDGWTIQGFEFDVSARVNDDLEGFVAYHLFYDRETAAWDSEFEEWFGKVKNLPGGFELRGGRYLNRFGIQNSIHLHGWDYSDQYLVNGRFLGDDGLYTIGGEVTWKLPVSWTSLLSASIGVPPDRGPHAHAHGEEAGEAEFEAGGAALDKEFVAANWTNQFDYNDFHQFRGGLSGAWGRNLWGRTTQIYGAHLEYQWRENGYEPGGRYFRWRTEAMLRAFDAVSGHLPGEEESGESHGDEEHHSPAHPASLDEFGIYSSLLYGLDKGLEFELRGEYVSGIASAGLDERFRVGPAVTYFLNRNRTMFLRTQFNYDHSSDFGDACSVWAQVGINWGGPEVR